MKIFIELPTWLGDAIMATPAIELLCQYKPDASITLFGSYVSTEALKRHPNVDMSILDQRKKNRWGWWHTWQQLRTLEDFDLAISFRSSLSTRPLLQCLTSKKRLHFPKQQYHGHQVEKYVHFMADALHVTPFFPPLQLYHKPYIWPKMTLGLNPGATYGSAKRWYPQEFAAVALHFSNRFDIVIFGGPNEVGMASEIAAILAKHGISNYINLAGKTTVTELIERIAGLSLFVTNDSGPMHVASAYHVPTVALFGPTRYTETSPWQNPNSYILSHHLSCSPCMKRECPLKTHACMREIKAEEVILLLERHLSLGT